MSCAELYLHGVSLVSCQVQCPVAANTYTQCKDWLCYEAIHSVVVPEQKSLSVCQELIVFIAKSSLLRADDCSGICHPMVSGERYHQQSRLGLKYCEYTHALMFMLYFVGTSTIACFFNTSATTVCL